MAIPVYQRKLPSGAVRDQVAGLTANSATTFVMPAAAVSGYAPAAGDTVIDADGVARAVTEATLFEGEWFLVAPLPS